jgi:hypothetical protein
MTMCIQRKFVGQIFPFYCVYVERKKCEMVLTS